jgi:uncharacterized protein involved in exopolysaccharide biosynthesis
MATLQTLPEAAQVLPAHAPGGAGASTIAARSFLYAVFKHRRLVLGVFTIVFLGSAIAAFIRPSTWLASTKVLVKLGETVQLAPAEAPSRSINVPLNQEVVKTEADIVKSWEVVEEAIHKLGIKPEDGSDEQELIDGLRRGLTVTQTPGTNVLAVSFLGRNPDKAARMVNAITDVYIDHHNKVYRREGMYHFYNEQLRILEQQMLNSQRKLRDYLKKTGVVDVEQEIRLLAMDEVQQDKGLRAHMAKIKATDRKIVNLKEQLERTPAQVAFAEEYSSNPTALTFKNKLAELEVEKYNLEQKYTGEARQVKDINAQIASVKGRLKAEQDRILGKQTVRSNDLYVELQRNLFSLEQLLSDARAREPAMRRRLKSTQKRLRKLRDRRFVIANMEQEAEQKKYAFDLYYKKHEEARITEAMTDQSMVNVSVVEYANPPLEPENGVLLPLIMGLVGGLALATAMAVAVEYLNRRLRFEEEVERYLELPVLAVIPDLETTPDLASV